MTRQDAAMFALETQVERDWEVRTGQSAYEEREIALEQDAMTDGEWRSAALSQYASAHGADRRDCAWICTPYDTWEANPYYVGTPVNHPESCGDEGDYFIPQSFADASRIAARIAEVFGRAAVVRRVPGGFVAE